MKYLFIALLLLTACKSQQDKDVKQSASEYMQLPLPDFKHRSLYGFGGEIDFINDNSWLYTMFINSDCINKTNSSCRKAMTSYVDDIATNRVIKTSFEFTLTAYNVDNPPDWVIVFQDWVRIIDNDKNGNHPISTLKLKTFDGIINLCHYDNSWQWGYDFGDNKDEHSIDIDHTLHQENTLNGCKEIDLYVTYNIDVIVDDDGRFRFIVNDKLISDKHYKTKKENAHHDILWGIYLSKGYNADYNPNLNLALRIDNLKLYILTD